MALLSIRKLPGSASLLIDSQQQNNVFLNPSYAHPIICIRGTVRTPIEEHNYALLHNVHSQQQTRVDISPGQLADTVNLFTGLEDMRVCWHADRLWFTATCTHASGNMTSELVVGRMREDMQQIELVQHVDIGSTPVKNICPFSNHGDLWLLDVMHMRMHTIEVVDGEILLRRCMGLASGSLQLPVGMRGSTSPVHLHGNTWGCVVHSMIVHETASHLVSRLNYVHYWMEVDVITGEVTFISTPFWVAKWGVEYVSGIHLGVAGNVTLYMGVDDQTPLAYKTTLHDLRAGL